MARHQQVELVDKTDPEETLVCWLPVDSRVKPGAIVELKQLPGILWTVRAVYGAQMEREDIRRDWRVGGLV